MASAVSHKTVFQLAWPIVISNLSTPLLGLVDTAVVGNLGNPVYIGAVAVGSMIFSFLFWGFGFLRMGTTGLVSQAAGAEDHTEIKGSLYRSLLIGVSIGFILIFLQLLLSDFALKIISASQEVEMVALTYFSIRIWGAPFNLALLSIMGFMLGIQNARHLLTIQLFLNGMNILLDILFVVVFEWGVPGVAMATVLAEIMAVALGLAIIRSSLKPYASTHLTMEQLLNKVALKRMASVNSDIMIRTLCLIFAFAWFTNQGASFGDITLATNAILMQFVTFSAFFLDGFALAAESLVGTSVGAGNESSLRKSIRYCFDWALATSIVLSLVFWWVGTWVISFLTNVEAVVDSSHNYLAWPILVPLISFSCYLLDGIFIGATKTTEMRNAMLLSLSGYLVSWYLLADTWGNHGLWASLMIFFILRAVTLFIYLPRLFRTPGQVPLL